MTGAQHRAAVVAYLDAVCARIRHREVHHDIRRELEGHIADRIEEYTAAGLADAEAEARALAQMGDPNVVGQQLDRAHRPRTAWGLLTAAAAFTLLGIWAMYAAEASGSWRTSGLLQSKLIWSGLGLAAGAVLFFVDYRRLHRWSWPLYGLTLLGLALLPLTQRVVNGRIAHAGATPVLFILALAGISAGWQWARPRALPTAAALMLVPPLAYLLLGELFAVVEYVVGFSVLMAATRPGRREAAWLAAAAGGVLLALAMAIAQAPHRVGRILSWLNPGRDPQGSGYQIVQSLEALRSAGPWGRGATAPLRLLPEIPSDFIFPYLVYTLGWVAGAAIVILACLLVIQLWRVSARTREPFGRHLATAVGTIFALHFGWNLLMTAGLVPIAEVGLPLVSHGARQVLYLAAAGLVLNVHRRRHPGGPRADAGQDCTAGSR